MPRAGNQTVTIPSGSVASSNFSLRGAAVGLFIPSGTLTGGTVNYHVSADGTTFIGLRDSAGVLLAQTVSGTMAWAAPSALLAAPFGRLVSNAAEGGARSITLATRGE